MISPKRSTCTGESSRRLQKKNWSCSKLQRISRAARWCMSVNIFSCWLTKQHFSLCFSIRFSFSIERLHSSSCCRDGRFIVRGDFFILERFFWIFFVAINLFVFRGFFFLVCRPTFVCGRGKKGKRRKNKLPNNYPLCCQFQLVLWAVCEKFCSDPALIDVITNVLRWCPVAKENWKIFQSKWGWKCLGISFRQWFPTAMMLLSFYLNKLHWIAVASRLAPSRAM